MRQYPDYRDSLKDVVDVSQLNPDKRVGRNTAAVITSTQKIIDNRQNPKARHLTSYSPSIEDGDIKSITNTS